MRKAKSMLGLNVISRGEGKQLGKVHDLIFDAHNTQLIALLISDRDLFGLIDAQVVPYSQIVEIGPDAVMVPHDDALVKVHSDPVIAEVFDQKKKLDGKKVTTQNGEDLGSVSDLYLDDMGTILGYEVSGGLFTDAFSGKRYMAAPKEITIGEDVILVPPSVAAELQRQKEEEPGGLAATYDSAKQKVTETYGNIAQASVEKQREFVIGKTAGHDVVLPADKATMASPSAITTTAVEDGALVPDSGQATSDVGRVTPASATDVSSSGEVVDGEVLVRKGETITAQHADRAIAADMLGTLVTAATTGAVSGAVGSGQESASGYGAQAQDRIDSAVIGKPAAREVVAPDGTIIVAPGMLITQSILDRADQYGKKGEVVAVGSMGAASQGAQNMAASAKEGAASLWETVKEKTAELTGMAHEKKAEYDASAEQSKINNALGRPTTRVILDKSDAVILNTGDLITHAAVERSREAGVLEVLLDSVYTADPEITPEMMRAQEKGEAALDSQAQPSGGPITATVSPEAQSQDAPSQN